MSTSGGTKARILSNSSQDPDKAASKRLGRPSSVLTPSNTHMVPPSPSSDDSMGSIPDESDADDFASTHGADSSYDFVNSEAFQGKHIYELATQVATLLKRIVEQNDRIPFSSERLTRFHSRAPPGISIRDYLVRIIRYCSLDRAILLVLLYFVDLFSQSYAHFNLNTLTVHRFLITAATVASKGLCDQFCSNTHYAKVGGVSVVELNLLEVEFLTRVRYRIIAPTSLLWQYFTKCEESPVALPSPKIETSPPRKHAREDSSTALANTATPAPATYNPPPPPTKPRGLKAVRDTFRFLHPTKKKKEDDASNV